MVGVRVTRIRASRARTWYRVRARDARIRVMHAYPPTQPYKNEAVEPHIIAILTK
jgi:hypothetical protein